MKSNLKRGIQFMAILIAVILLTNMLYIKLVYEKKRVYRAQETYQEYLQRLDTKVIDFAVFGDSHALNGINPEYVPGAYNYGEDGQNYFNTYYKFVNVLFANDKIKIRNIVIELDMHTFSSNWKNREFLTMDNLPYYAQFVPNRELSRIYNMSPISIWLYANFPMIGNGAEFKMTVSKNISNISLEGWLRKSKNFSSQNKSKIAREKFDGHFKDAELINPTSMNYFRKILSITEENNIHVIFVKYPVSKTYSNLFKEDNISRDEYYDQVFGYIDQELNDYTVFDYNDLFFNHSDYFDDPDHLNYIGAEVLSKRFYNDLVNEGFYDD